MAETILVERRFCGPPDSANGGYVCGRLAAFFEGPALVRLEVPPPLGVELVVRKADASIELLNGATVVARARSAEVSLHVPAAPSYAEADAATRSYRGFQSHPFPGCFVCGPRREAGDGLRIFPGPLGRDGLVASSWIPDSSLDDGSGRVRPEFLWSALDCPGGFSFELPPDNAVLLGEMGAAISGAVEIGERCTVIGWELGRDGRRHFTGTALFAASGQLAGLARATWFEVLPSPPG